MQPSLFGEDTSTVTTTPKALPQQAATKKPVSSTTVKSNNKYVSPEEKIEDLLHELTTSTDYYDLRMMRNHEDTVYGVDSISFQKDIIELADKFILVDEYGRLIHSRAGHVIRKLLNAGISEETIKEKIRTSQPRKLKEYMKLMLDQLNGFYKISVEDEITRGDPKRLATWICHAETSYRDYLRYPKYFKKPPVPCPDYIRQGKEKYKEICGTPYEEEAMQCDSPF